MEFNDITISSRKDKSNKAFGVNDKRFFNGIRGNLSDSCVGSGAENKQAVTSCFVDLTLHVCGKLHCNRKLLKSVRDVGDERS